jgi:hypothetical protein
MTQPHPHLYPTVTYADIAAELVREAAARARAYPDRVKKGAMTQQDADYQLALAAALRADCTRFAQAQPAGAPMVNPLTLPIGHSLTWAERRAGLQRELALRARFYPQWIAKGSLTQANATRQTDRLAALLACFEDGFDWQPTQGTRRAGLFPATADERVAELDFDRTFFPIHLARGTAPEFLALQWQTRWPHEPLPFDLPHTQEALAL